MIYLKGCDLLFLKPRKVGGTSFEIALSRYAEAGDIITPITPVDERARRKLGYRGAQNFAYGFSDIVGDRAKLWTLLSKRQLPRQYYNHMSAAETRALLGAERFDKALKVSIIRNPFDLLVSKYYWETKNRRNAPAFTDWLDVQGKIDFAKKNEAQYFIGNEFIVDHLIRYEHFEEDIMTLETMRPVLNGLLAVFSGINAKGGHRPPRADTATHYAGRTDLIEAVLIRYGWVFDKLQYPTP
ncbi:MAG: hypothetical protein AAF940_12730 [Pseudomonadota bacterium]